MHATKSHLYLHDEVMPNSLKVFIVFCTTKVFHQFFVLDALRVALYLEAYPVHIKVDDQFRFPSPSLLMILHPIISKLCDDSDDWLDRINALAGSAFSASALQEDALVQPSLQL